ncbi:hypothetical protein [Pseudomonas oryzihabitans]|uniref:hypothetical protein n=1 Tax=Pseudomonas oryzihabitans TaxID=47885 RepID=UPI00119F5555|nr:hypothetical protein [Pseudomonas oryzihabitans]
MSDLETLFNAADNLKSSNLDWAPDMLKELKNNPDEVKKFSSSPEEYIRSKGHDLPEGFHVHYIDETGTYYPEEPNMSPGDSGSRLEARIDQDNVAFAVCIWCKGGCRSAMV